MNILMIARFWDSSAGIGALRPMKMAKYFLRMGHSVTVVCGKEYAENPCVCDELRELRKQEKYRELGGFSYSGLFAKEDAVYKARNAPAAVKAKEAVKAGEGTPAKRKQSVLNKLKWYLYRRCYNELKVANAVRNAHRELTSCDLGAPDVILSSYAPVEVHVLAARLKKKYPGAFWISDFRDPLPNPMYQTKWIYRYNVRRQKRICAKADAVTIVSKTWRDEFAQQGIRRVFTIYSGYDPEDFTFDEKPEETGRAENRRLTFTYTGSLYPGLSDLTPFFSALNDLIASGALSGSQLRIVYAGAHGAEFSRQSAQLSPESGVQLENLGLVKRERALRLLSESDILLHALFCIPQARGIITGKLGEYWMSGKPIIAVITGTARADEFIDIIEASATGFAYDGTCHEQSYQKLKDYILTQAERKRDVRPLVYDPNEEFLRRFHYQEIANKMIGLAQRQETNR